MWQTDIFTFRLGGRYAYLIAFMDDYSRFIVGAELAIYPYVCASNMPYFIGNSSKFGLIRLYLF